MKSGIYKITNTTNGKFYIGSAKDIDWRWTIHKRDLRADRHCNQKLQHSWNYHGEDKFVFEILEETTSEQNILFEREQHYLDTLKPYVREIGYNIGSTAEGGDNITHHPDRNAFIEKMKIVNRGENNGMYGKTHSNEAIEKQKDKAKGRYTLEWFVERYGKREGKKQFEERNKMLSSRNLNCSYPNPRKGMKFSPMSEDTKKKLSDTKIRMKIQRKFLLEDIKSNRYSMLQLCEKYDIGMTAIKYHKRKLRMNGQL